MSDDPNSPTIPTSLLPYDRWLEDAHRGVVLKALDYLCQHGLPGEHHFYISFLTDYPGVDIPARLKDRYPDEMTIVLEKHFLNPTLSEDHSVFSVGLSFGGVPCTLHIPLKAITAFVDPHIKIALRFIPEGTPSGVEQDNDSSELYQDEPENSSHTPQHDDKKTPDDTPQQEAEVVSLAAFRKRHNKSESSTETEDPS